MRVSIPCVVLASIIACRSDAARDRGSETSDSYARTGDSLVTSTRSDTLPQVSPETLQVSARDSAAKEQIARIEPNRARLDSLLGTKGPVVRFYARLGKEDNTGCVEPIDSVVAVPNPEKWPDFIDASLVLVVEQGHVLAVREFPHSCSGDWENSYTHIFDIAGATVSFKRFSGFFNGCPRTTHEVSTYYFEPATGSLLAKRYSITDHDGNVFSPSLCEAFMYHYPYVIYSSWKAAARGLHLPLVIP